MMNKIHAVSLALCLSLVPVARAAEFGAVPDPYTGNWSGTLATDAGNEQLHATIIAYKDQFEVSFRGSPDPRDKTIAVAHGTVLGDRLILASAPEGVEGGLKMVC